MKYSLLLTALTIILISCSKKENEQTDWSKYELKGKVKSVREVTFDAMDKLGILQIGKVKNEGDFLEFNSDGFLIKNQNFGFHFVQLFEYDDQSKLLMQRSIYSTYTDSSLQNKILFQYNDKNLKIGEILYDKNGEVSSQSSFKYNTNRQIIEEDVNYPLYDSTWRGLIINGKAYRIESSVITTQYIANGKEKQVKQISKCLNPVDSSSIIDSIIVTDTYDKNGDKIERFKQFPNKLFERITFIYGKTGLLEEESYVSNLDGQDDSSDQDYYIDGNGDVKPARNKKIKYLYDKNGNKTEEQILFDGVSSTVKTYTYDSHGNWIRMVDDNMVDKEVTEREINYFGERQTVRLDSIVAVKRADELRDKLCNKEVAIQNVKTWMNNNYPDWKIVGDFTATQTDDCIYQVEFTAINPHFSGFGTEQKEIIIIEFSYVEGDYNRGYFKSIRGTLY